MSTSTRQERWTTGPSALTTCGENLRLGTSSECGSHSMDCRCIRKESRKELLTLVFSMNCHLRSVKLDILRLEGPFGELDAMTMAILFLMQKKKEMKEKRPKDAIRGKDISRAEEKVPRGHYKGMDFGEMSDVLNGWLNTSTQTKPCMDWDVKELQQLQALFYLARESQFDDIYVKTEDNRRLRHDTLKDLATNWIGLNEIASDHSDYRMKNIRRDGHCHEAVMWYVHHLSEDLKEVLNEARIPIPLLSPARHDICYGDLDEEGHKVCGAYKEQVTCASCHSNELPPSGSSPNPSTTP